MGAGTGPALSGQTILIVESDVVLVGQLQKALQAEGADVLVVTDPFSAAGTQRITGLIFTAAVVNDWYRPHPSLRHMPVLLYGRSSSVPAQADAIVGELKRLLGRGP